MRKPAYKLTIGSTTIDSSVDPTTSPIVSIEVELDMDIPADSFNIIIGQVNGLKVAKGDSVVIELGDNETVIKVIEGMVKEVEPWITQTRITGLNAISKLLDLRINQVYESQTAGAIVADLAEQAEITMDEKEEGITLPFYVIDNTKNAYEHIYDLAKKCGFDIYLTPDSKLTFKGFKEISGDHTFEYAKDIINLEITNQEDEGRQVIVWGESPASSKGDETSHWLTKKFDDYKGIVGSGTKYEIQDTTIKNKDSATTYAKAVLEDMKKNTINGSLTILGNAEVKLGNAIKIKGMPDPKMDGVFQVRKVQHLLGKETGFITKIGIRGLG